MNKADQILMLLTIVNTLTPLELDSHISHLIQDKFRLKQHRMKTGTQAAFEEAFNYATPKTINSEPGNFVNLSSEQLFKFIDLVSSYIPIIQIQIQIGSFMDSYLPGTVVSVATIDGIIWNSTYSALKHGKNTSVKSLSLKDFQTLSIRQISLQNEVKSLKSFLVGEQKTA